MSDKTRRHPLARLLSYADSHRSRVWMATAFSVLNKLFDLAPPALIGVAVDVVVEKEQSLIARMGIVDTFDQLVALAAVTVVVWAAESAFQYAYAWYWRNLAQTIQHELRLDAYDHIQRLDLAYFHEESTGSLMAILNDDVNQLERFLDNGANDLIQVATTAVAISITFFVLAPSVAWMAMLPIPLIIWGSFKYQDLLAPRYAEVRERVGMLNSRLSNNLTGIATIKSFTTEQYERGRIEEESDEYRQANRRAIKLSAAFSPLIRMIIVIGFVATLVYGGKLTVDGELAVGTYSVLVFLTQRLLWPLTRLGQTFDLYQRAMASTNRVLNLLEKPIHIDDGDDEVETDAVDGEIVFEDVTFSYPGREPTLDDFNLTIPAGATVGIVGSTGSGKTTLINLLLRFYDPQEGRVVIDGKDISEFDLESLRRAIGLVSQDAFLFHGSVRENVEYGTFEADDAMIRSAAESAEATEFIDEMPRQFDTVVGERGQTLSGGQQQRISIARAVLKDPPILVLDEATSAVDNETEAAIQRSLEHITAERTTLVVAHRLSTIRNADKIVVMRDGKIAEEGRHDDLVAMDGIYANLWRVQTGEKPAGRAA
ncbi:MAG: ABC transporter ATP-binding protein [Myxococcota bacterium]